MGRIGHSPTTKHPSRVLLLHHEVTVWFQMKLASLCKIVWSLYMGGRGEGEKIHSLGASSVQGLRETPLH